MIAAGQTRPVTVANVRIALDLAWLMAPRCWQAIMNPDCKEIRRWVAAHVASLVVEAVVPAAQLWATSRLLDLAERSLSTGEPAAWGPALYAGALVMFFKVFTQYMTPYFSMAETMVIDEAKIQVEKSFFRLQLRTTMEQSADPVHSGLMTEASVHAGLGYMATGRTINHNLTHMSNKIQAVGQLFSFFISLGTQLFVVVHILQTNGSAMVNTVFIVLFTLPVVVKLWTIQSDHMVHRGWNPNNSTYMGSALRDVISGPSRRDEVALFGLDKWLLGIWEQAQKDNNRDRWEANDARLRHGAGLMVLTSALQNGVLILLATRVLGTNSSLASLTLLQTAIMTFSRDIERAFRHARRVMDIVIILAAYFGAIDNEKATPDGTVDYEKRRTAGGMSIEVRDLSVTYPKSDKAAVHGINLKIDAGETLAIVGFNGGGKTTLVKAIMGLVPFSGEVLVNDMSTAQYRRATLYQRITGIFQNFSKYPLTLRDNIGAGNVDALRRGDDEVLHQAVERGGAQHVVERTSLDSLLSYTEAGSESHFRRAMQDQEGDSESESEDDDAENAGPNGKDTKKTNGTATVDDKKELDGNGNDNDKAAPKNGNGKTGRKPKRTKTGRMPFWMLLKYLSGGEWQRIALARAFMRTDPDLVVFDEPTSALDPRAEAELFDRLHSLGTTCTTIFISHGFGNVRRADKIAFMDDGTIKEYGTHDELMALGGKYAELFALQRDRFGFDGDKTSSSGRQSPKSEVDKDENVSVVSP